MLGEPVGVVFGVHERAFSASRHEGSDLQPYLLAGEPRDLHAGLYYNRARWLDTSVGRFVSADSWPVATSDPFSLHSYLYGNANPVGNSDPSGYFTVVQALFGLVLVGLLVSLKHTTPAPYPTPTYEILEDKPDSVYPQWKYRARVHSPKAQDLVIVQWVRGHAYGPKGRTDDPEYVLDIDWTVDTDELFEFRSAEYIGEKTRIPGYVEFYDTPGWQPERVCSYFGNEEI